MAPHSGRVQAFPEVDRAASIDLDTARRKIRNGQAGLLEEQPERLEDQSR